MKYDRQRIYGECLFFDVGQGTANVVLLSNGHVLILDVGPLKAGPVHDFLEDNRIEAIDCVVLSHNDKDHIQGWESLAMRYGHIIKEIYLVQDRAVEKGDMLDVTMCLADEKVIPMPIRAEIRDIRERLCVWESSDKSMKLELLYPDMFANTRAQVDSRANDTCAISLLSCEDDSVLFPGDSTLAAWERMKTIPDVLPIKVKVLAIPHHGGFSKKEVSLGDFVWLLSEAIIPDTAIISVGTNNSYGHPRNDILSALRELSIDVMCTEITCQCCHKSQMADIRRGVIAPEEYSLSAYCLSDLSDMSHIGCASTIIATVGDNGVRILRKREHQLSAIHRVKRSLEQREHPCRKLQ